MRAKFFSPAYNHWIKPAARDTGVALSATAIGVGLYETASFAKKTATNAYNNYKNEDPTNIPTPPRLD
jgi:predicted NodU family carbamoyl transferase